MQDWLNELHAKIHEGNPEINRLSESASSRRAESRVDSMGLLAQNLHSIHNENVRIVFPANPSKKQREW